METYSSLARIILLNIFLGTLLLACSSNNELERVLKDTKSEENGVVFQVQASERCAGERIVRFRVTDAEKIRRFDLLAGQGSILIGTVREGDGGINSPWSWHLETDSANLVDTAVACMLCPSDVQADVAGFVSGTRLFCLDAQVLPR